MKIVNPVFIYTISALLVFTSLTLLVQMFFILGSTSTFNGAIDNDQDFDQLVLVGEMYFRQDGSSGSVDQITAKVDEVIKFYNEGLTSHTVTVPEFDLDEVIHPGESVYLLVGRAVERVLVSCRFHFGHEATMTVVRSD